MRRFPSITGDTYMPGSTQGRLQIEGAVAVKAHSRHTESGAMTRSLLGVCVWDKHGVLFPIKLDLLAVHQRTLPCFSDMCIHISRLHSDRCTGGGISGVCTVASRSFGKLPRSYGCTCSGWFLFNRYVRNLMLLRLMLRLPLQRTE